MANHKHVAHLHFSDSRRFLQSFWVKYEARDGRWVAARDAQPPAAMASGGSSAVGRGERQVR